MIPSHNSTLVPSLIAVKKAKEKLRFEINVEIPIIICFLLFFPQERNNTYDTMRFPSLESHLLDIMRTTSNDPHDHFKGKNIEKPCIYRKIDPSL